MNERLRAAGGERDERYALHASVIVGGWLGRANLLIDARAGINQAEVSKECQNAVSRRERERPVGRLKNALCQKRFQARRAD
jgi:hypothetical protein